MSALENGGGTEMKNKTKLLTFLLFCAVAVLLTLIPTVYGILARPLGRVMLLVCMLVAVLVLAYVLLRHLYRRIHGAAPARGNLTLAIVGSAVMFLLVAGIAATATALLFGVFNIPFTDGQAFNTETVVGIVLNGVLFPFLFCFVVATLKEVHFGKAFWGVYGNLIKRRALLIFMAALVCLALNTFVHVFLPEAASVAFSVLLTALLLTVSFEIAMTQN
jgi:hypothetical protein